MKSFKHSLFRIKICQLIDDIIGRMAKKQNKHTKTRQKKRKQSNLRQKLFVKEIFPKIVLTCRSRLLFQSYIKWRDVALPSKANVRLLCRKGNDNKMIKD